MFYYCEVCIIAIKILNKFIVGSILYFRCSICGEEKCGYENFLGHKLRHANKFCFSCKHCGRGFYRKTDGKRHEEKATCLFGKRSPFIKMKTTKDGTFKSYGLLKPEEVSISLLLYNLVSYILCLIWVIIRRKLEF